MHALKVSFPFKGTKGKVVDIWICNCAGEEAGPVTPGWINTVLLVSKVDTTRYDVLFRRVTGGWILNSTTWPLGFRHTLDTLFGFGLSDGNGKQTAACGFSVKRSCGVAFHRPTICTGALGSRLNPEGTNGVSWPSIVP